MTLITLLNGEDVGVVEQQPDGQLRFRYDPSWAARTDALPLSMSMPLSRSTYPDSVIRPWLSGLLPDNARVLERWAREFQVSPRNPFALLRYMGEDCAGAVQFVVPERLGAVEEAAGNVEWLDEAGVGARLRDVVTGAGTGRLTGDLGRFSLAGAQPKTALYYDGTRWGIPSGATPTTHILKPPVLTNFGGLAENEHFCLRLAQSLGMPAAESRVMRFDGYEAIVLKRFDRVAENGTMRRLHQEDLCQALGVPPERKYENEGGPGAEAVVDLLGRESSNPGQDVAWFLDALVLNWAICGTDAHAKNYALLISGTGVRLAPLFDLISALPYSTEIPVRQQKLAMRVGTEYQTRKIQRWDWERLAERCELDAAPVLTRVRELLGAIPAATKGASRAVRDEGVVHPVIAQLEQSIVANAEDCLRRMA